MLDFGLIASKWLYPQTRDSQLHLELFSKGYIGTTDKCM